MDNTHLFSFIGAGCKFGCCIYNWSVFLFNYSISAGLVRSYSDLPEIVMLEEEVGPFLVICTTVNYHIFWGPEPTTYLLLNDVGSLH
jgi:hypothetical protein